jgi:hypothetical protein
MGVRDWDIVTSYVDSVTTSLKTVTFPKVQEQVKVKNQGNANLTYTIGSQSGTLTPGQSVTVNEDISSFTIQAASGTQAFELRAKEKGTEQTEAETDVMIALADSTQQLTDIVVTARKVGLIASDSTKATQNATTLNQYLSTAQSTEITFLGKEYFFDDTLIVTGTNKLIGKKGTKFSLTVTNKDCIYLKPFGVIENVLINLPLNHTKAGISLHDSDYTQWVSNHLHFVRNVFIYGHPTSLNSIGISLDAANGYNVSNFSCNNVTILNCLKGVSITASGTGWASGNFFDNIYPQNCVTGISINGGGQGGSGNGQIGGNRFIYEHQFSTNGQTAVYCNGFENSFIGKVWDATTGKIVFNMDNGSQNNFIIGTTTTPNIMNGYIIDNGQDNVFFGYLNNVPQVKGTYKYDANSNYQTADWQKFYGSYSDILFNADKLYTVNLTLGGSSVTFGSLATLFSNQTMAFANTTSASPIAIEIIFPTPLNYIPEFGITFYGGKIAQNVKIEYASSSGGTYSTSVNTTSNRNYKVSVATSAYGATIGKVKFTLSGGIVNATTSPSGTIGIGNIYMYSTEKLGTYYLPSSGGSLYGNLNMVNNYLTVGSVASLPTASATYRGQIIYVQGNGTTTADTAYQCLMSATGTYSWKQIISG